MTDEATKAAECGNRGAVVKLFGVILIILGVLNTMLSWRGGFEILSLPVCFIIAGLLLNLIGSILRSGHT